MTDTQEIKDKVRAGDFEGVKTSVTDAAEQARRKAEEMGRNAKERMEQGRSAAAEAAAEAMDKTAEGLRQTKMAAASNVAGGLNNAADYIRQNSFGDMFSDVSDAIRRNPAPSLLAAVALGFILGSALRRN